MEIYRIENLSFSYPLRESKALDDINLIVESGEFISICGKSGSGKSSLIRQLKSVLAPHGKKEGKIYFNGLDLLDLDDRSQASQIGYVLQNPDNQIVTDKVWHELAFGLESLGYDSGTIRLRVAEIASFFGIHNWFHKKVEDLSGGQKQILNLASIMAMQPRVLILDEPTSQLDPVAASDFIETIKKINRELGTTVIITEHRLEEIIPVSDRLVVMDKGKIIGQGRPESVGRQLKDMNHPMFKSMTSAMQISSELREGKEYCITVNDGRNLVDSIFENIGEIKKPRFEDEELKNKADDEIAVELKNVWFKYDKNLADVIKGMSLRIPKKEIYCILGGNGTGKTTTVSLIGGIHRPYRGKILLNGKDLNKMTDKEKYTNNLGLLPQDPQLLFLKKTVRLDLEEMLDKSEEARRQMEDLIDLLELNKLLDMHPYDLSGGEQQRLALGKVLLLDPKILILDEPTKGLDNFFKNKLAAILAELKNRGVSIIMVSHDVEFCAKYGDTCAMVFDGQVIVEKPTREFFAGNNFYTTSANRIGRHICKEALTIEDVIDLCQINL